MGPRQPRQYANWPAYTCSVTRRTFMLSVAAAARSAPAVSRDRHPHPPVRPRPPRRHSLAPRERPDPGPSLHIPTGFAKRRTDKASKARLSSNAAHASRTTNGYSTLRRTTNRLSHWSVFWTPGNRVLAASLSDSQRTASSRGIRYGNLWGRSLVTQLSNPSFVNDMALLAEAGLSLDTANPDLDLLEGMLHLADRVPTLRMIVDHLPKIVVPQRERGRYETALAGVLDAASDLCQDLCRTAHD